MFVNMLINKFQKLNKPSTKCGYFLYRLLKFSSSQLIRYYLYHNFLLDIIFFHKILKNTFIANMRLRKFLLNSIYDFINLKGHQLCDRINQ